MADPKKVRLTMEFISNESYPSDDEWSRNQNLFLWFNHSLMIDIMMKLIDAKADPDKKHYIRKYEEQIRIGKEMVASIKTEVLD